MLGRTTRAPSPRPRRLLFAAAAALVAIVGIPRSPRSAAELLEERESQLLRVAQGELEGAIHDYRREHGDWPGRAPEGPLDRPGGSDFFVRQLTLPSDARGRTTESPDDAHPFGPYLARIPANPANGLRDVLVPPCGAALPPHPDGTSGWLFDAVTGELRSNATGAAVEERADG